MQHHTATIHGRRVAYRTAGGDGEPLLLIHGITQDASTWQQLAPHLAEDEGTAPRVIAIDLPGHGDSQSPAGDHSLGAYASTVRDLLFYLDLPSATIVGHSLGGGVALQFAYQFPEMVQRLVLVDSGGLGRDVSLLLRAATLPGAEAVLALLTSETIRGAGRWLGEKVRGLGLRPDTDLETVQRALAGMSDPEARKAFLWTARATIGIGGQRVSAEDKLYLAQHVPTLLLWGARDRIIPVTHATAAHRRIPGSELHVLDEAGHFPHQDHPAEVAGAVRSFLGRTAPADVPREAWGRIVRGGAPAA